MKLDEEFYEKAAEVARKESKIELFDYFEIKDAILSYDYKYDYECLDDNEKHIDDRKREMLAECANSGDFMLLGYMIVKAIVLKRHDDRFFENMKKKKDDGKSSSTGVSE